MLGRGPDVGCLRNELNDVRSHLERGRCNDVEWAGCFLYATLHRRGRRKRRLTKEVVFVFENKPKGYCVGVDKSAAVCPVEDAY